ncbi:MAG: EF-hand domain-containing protein [Brachymonas sp.]
MNISAKTLTRFAVAATLCLTAASGFAQSETPKHGGMRKLDTNKDKLISREEAKANPALSKHFEAIDTNKDGQLSRDEMKSFHQANKADQDGDGNISKAEAANKPHLAKNFDKIDTNKDGILTPAERKAWMEAHKGQAKK